MPVEGMTHNDDDDPFRHYYATNLLFKRLLCVPPLESLQSLVRILYTLHLSLVLQVKASRLTPWAGEKFQP